jgi:hypothetical protein
MRLFGAEPSFADGFEGGFDGSRWTTLYGGSTYQNGAFRWDRSLVAVGGGSLRIGVRPGAGGVWRCGGVSMVPQAWAPGHSFRWGKVCFRLRATRRVVGAGPCVLLWPSTNDHWPPEIDMLETPRGRGMFSVHRPGSASNQLFDVDVSEWHDYALEWTPRYCLMRVDGEPVGLVREGLPEEPMSFGIQGHVGAPGEAWYGHPEAGSEGLDILLSDLRIFPYIGPQIKGLAEIGS